MGDQFVYVENNQVEYYEACKESGGTKYVINDLLPEFEANDENDRHHEVAPSIFHVGDIVEAQLSFEVIRLKGKCSKMIVVLRALTLLDKGEVEVSMDD